MKLKTFGRSELSVTPLGFGLAAVGRPGYINLGHAQDLNENYNVDAMAQHAHQLLDAAWASGIRYFDAARSYGRAELFLSTWLAARNIAPDEVTIGSKWGYTYTADWNIEAEDHEIKEHSLAALHRQYQESIEILGPYLSLYQIHSATMESGVLTNSEVLSKLAHLRAGGLKIGLSLSGPYQAETLRQALAIRFDGELLFSAVQATWNLLAQEAGLALSEANAAGMGVIIKEALANGRLTARNLASSFTEKRSMLEEVAAFNDTSIDAVALAAVLDQPWVDVVLSGAANVLQLDSNVKALDIQGTFDMVELLQKMREPAAVYWQERSWLPWN